MPEALFFRCFGTNGRVGVRTGSAAPNRRRRRRLRNVDARTIAAVERARIALADDRLTSNVNRAGAFDRLDFAAHRAAFDTFRAASRIAYTTRLRALIKYVGRIAVEAHIANRADAVAQILRDRIGQRRRTASDRCFIDGGSSRYGLETAVFACAE